MSSTTDRPVVRSAAWRISLWSTLAFALGTMVIFLILDRFVANDIQRRSDAWLTGEVETLGDVAEHTPNNALYNRVVGEVAELAAHEVPNRLPNQAARNDSVFFLQTTPQGALKLWVGAGNAQDHLDAIQARVIQPDQPTSIRVRDVPIPFRVASITIDDGSRIFLGLSERDEIRVLMGLRFRFFWLWLSLVLLGFAMVFLTSRRMLSHVRSITQAASRIGHSDLGARVPTSRRNDEIAQLALTINGMLDRIENSMHQLHTITDSLAHDLRSPLTAIRGQLETFLSGARDSDRAEQVAAVLEEVDRLTDFLNKSLDVAEARADALRLAPTEIDLAELLRAMVALYEPSMSERGLRVRLVAASPVKIVADEGLIHRVTANLFDNELKHLTAGCLVTVELFEKDGAANLIVCDNGPGFDSEIRLQLFTGRVKGKHSTGHGLGLAFVDAVVRAHGGAVSVSNEHGGGARIVVTLPLVPSATPVH